MMGKIAPLMLACWVLAACADNSHIVPERVSCGSCEVRISEVLRIGEPDGPGSLAGRPTSLAQDSAGRFWLGMLDYGFPFVYDREGRFLQQFGQPGEGPGEFRWAVVEAGLPADSMLLSTGLSYVIVGPDRIIARTVKRATRHEPTGIRIASWPSNVLALVISLEGRTLTSQVELLDFSGDRVVSRSMLAPAEGSMGPVYRRVEPAASNDVWISYVTQYKLRRYSSAGEVLDSLERQPAWFPPSDGIPAPSPRRAPSPIVAGFRADSRGRLWIWLDRPRADWRNAWEGISYPEGASEVRVASLPPGYELWKSVLEIIDPVSRRVVARTELDGQVFAILQHDLVATWTELESGIPIVTIHRLTLVE
jgi:hypothetical protein